MVCLSEQGKFRYRKSSLSFIVKNSHAKLYYTWISFLSQHDESTSLRENNEEAGITKSTG